MHSDGSGIRLEYVARGQLDRIALPSPAAEPRRMDRLWEHTCFEAFFGRIGSSEYLELNLSPAGHWNLYRFNDYRSGMRPDTEIEVEAPRTSIQGGAHNGALLLETRLSLPPDRITLMGVTAVIELKDTGETRYLAIRHPAAKPDFHDRDGWTPISFRRPGDLE